MVDVAFVIPAYQAASTLGQVLADLRAALLAVMMDDATVIVIDDGSTDGTAEVAETFGVCLLRHGENRGKGAAIRTALLHAKARGMPQIVTLDADGQHPAVEAVRLARHPRFDALILGVRNLKESGAPGPNRFSNAFSNLVLSGFAGRRLLDTQCGLRRYPVERTLVLGARDDGYAYESNLVLRAARFKLPIVHVPVSVIYPPEHERVSHFHSLRDPFKIVLSVVGTALTCFPRRRFSMPKDVPAA